MEEIMSNKEFREFAKERDKVILNVLSFNVKVMRLLKKEAFQGTNKSDREWQEIFQHLLDTNVMMCQSLLLDTSESAAADVPQELLYGIPKEDYQQVEMLENLLTSDEGDDTIEENDNGKDR
jgi:hypothetical protein